MRIPVVTSARSCTQPEELPGIVGKRSMIVGLAIVLTLSVCSTAWAVPIPERTYSDRASQPSGPVAAERSYSDGATHPSAPMVAERTFSDAPAAAASERADSDTLVAPAAAVAPSAPSDDGLSALAIVLISVAGAVTLGAAAYTTRRLIHHGHAAT